MKSLLVHGFIREVDSASGRIIIGYEGGELACVATEQHCLAAQELLRQPQRFRVVVLAENPRLVDVLTGDFPIADPQLLNLWDDGEIEELPPPETTPSTRE